MIKRKDLRIGNLIQDAYGEVSIVYELHYNDAILSNALYGVPYSLLKPIPLTEERLLRFGFEKRDGNASLKEEYKKPNNYYYDLAEFGVYYPDTKEINLAWSSDHDTVIVSLDSVHRLQNLYFEVKGIEL